MPRWPDTYVRKSVCPPCGGFKTNEAAMCWTCWLATSRSPRPAAPGKQCRIAGCIAERDTRGLCNRHYSRWRRGNLDIDAPVEKRPSAEERFWSRVQSGTYDDCWLWTGSLTTSPDKDGYGRFTINSKTIVAHHYAYELLIGPVPDGLFLDHLCRVRRCVNPWHLEPVPHRVNALRGVSIVAHYAQMTHCIHGHPFDEANTYVTKKGHRQCRICALDSCHKYRAKKRAS